MRAPSAERLLQLAGVGLWIAVGAPAFFAPSALLTGAGAAWLAAWIGWLAAFVAFSEIGPRGRHCVPLLAAQLVAALVSSRVGLGSNESALVLAIAGQLPFVLPLGASLAWVLAQTVLLVGVTLPLTWATLGRTVGFATFELFALSAAYLAVREARAREELAQVNAELLATRELLAETARVGERLRISRDLHDTLGHHLTALTLELEVAAHADGAKAVEHVERAQAVARLLLAEVRDVVSEIRSDRAIDLAHALGTLARGVDRPRVHLDLPAALEVRATQQAEVVFRCVQEVVTNARRHAEASNVWVKVTAGENGLEIEARDDGRGAADARFGHGLAGMRERVQEAGGRLEAGPHPAGGFRVHAVLPA